MNYRRIANIENRRIVALEKKYTVIVRRALKEQMISYAEKKTIGLAMTEALRNLYEKELKYWLEREYKRLKKDRTKANRSDFFLHTWLEWVDEALYDWVGSRVVGINETTRDIINRIIQEGYDKGLEWDVIATKITTQAKAITTFKRARTIARTELANTVNYAKMKSSLDFEKETGLLMDKYWVHRGSNDPRDEHLRLDKMQIHRDDTFTAYGERIDYPHAPGLSAKNVVNCNCQVIYVRRKD